jgi:hypothetical protein
VKTKSPSELAQINSLSDLPVPTPILNLLSPSKKAEEKKKRFNINFNLDLKQNVLNMFLAFCRNILVYKTLQPNFELLTLG